MKPIKADSEFCLKVYKITAKIPKGKVMSYNQIAKILKSAPRAVGQALRKNPNKHVPCKRVVMSDGSIGGYGGVPNSKKKLKILKEEGVTFKNGKIIEKCFYRP